MYVLALLIFDRCLLALEPFHPVTPAPDQHNISEPSADDDDLLLLACDEPRLTDPVHAPDLPALLPTPPVGLPQELWGFGAFQPSQSQLPATGKQAGSVCCTPLTTFFFFFWRTNSTPRLF